MIDLIIEDGSIVEGANSYATVQQIIDYAAARGVTMQVSSPSPGDDEPIKIMAIKAMDFLETYRYQWKGEEVNAATQPLAWPRKNVIINCVTLPSNTIPTQIIRAQCQLCLYVNAGIDLQPVGNSEAFVKREKIGPIETEYSEVIAASAGALPVLYAFDSIIGAFLRQSFALRTVRV